MKKSILFIAIAAITFVSCKKETIEPTPEPTPTPTLVSGSFYKFYVPAAQQYSQMELYSATTMVLDTTLSISTISDPNYQGNVFLLDDSTYIVKVKYSSSYFYQGEVKCNLGALVTHTDTQGLLTVTSTSPPQFKIQP